MKQTLLVTGASGLIGSAVLKLLWNAPALSVIAVYNNHRPVIFGRNITHVKNDLTAGDSVSCLAVYPCDGIIHCAAHCPSAFDSPDDEKCAATNALMDHYLLDYAVSRQLPVVYFSSTAVYGFRQGNALIDEDSATASAGLYAEQKLAAERTLSRAALPYYAVLRISAPYGPFQRTNSVMNLFIRQALAHRPLQYYGTGGRHQDFTFSFDIARAALLALQSRNAGTYIVASGQPVSTRSLAEQIVALLHSNSVVEPAGIPDPQELYSPRYDTSRIRTALGWSPLYTLADGIREMADYFRELAA